MNLNNLLIRHRLFYSFFIVFALTVLMGFVIIWQSSLLWQNTKKLYDHPYVVSNAIRDIRSTIYEMNKTMTLVLSVENENQLLSLAGEVEKLEHIVESKYELIADSYLGEKEDIETSLSSYYESRKIRDEVLHFVTENQKPDAKRLMRETGLPQMQKLLSDILILQNFASNKADEFYNEAKNTHILTNVILLFSMVFLLMLIIIISFVLMRSINRPLKHLHQVAEAVQSGDWDKQVSIKGKDELVFLGQTLNRMIDSLKIRASQEKSQRELGDIIIASKQVKEFSENVVSTVVRVLKAQVGAFYRVDEYDNLFKPHFCLGLNKDQLPLFNAETFEGGIGHSLLSGKIERVIQKASDSKFIYKTILGELIPDELVTIPIRYESEISGILILGKTGVFSENEMDFLTTTRPVITAAFSNLLRADEARKLNQDLNHKNQELQAQTEELETQSEELLSLTQTLQGQNQQLEEVQAELREEKTNLDKTVETRTCELEKAKIRAEESDTLKTAFLANMSHEIRTPMNAILGFSELLNDKDLSSEDLENYVEIINFNGEHLLHLINDIVEISKIEAGEFSVSIKPFQPSLLFDEVLGSYEGDQQLMQKKLELKLNIPDDAVIHTVKLDYHRIKQVINNFMNNAIKFTDKGHIELGYKIDKQGSSSEFVFWVKDTGIGIAKDQTKKIFERFVQADTKLSKKYEGTGLGLAISKAIVEHLNGEIIVDSKLGKGTTFFCKFPA